VAVCARALNIHYRAQLFLVIGQQVMQKGGQRDLFGRADLATTNYQVLLFPNFIPLSGVKSALYGGYACARRRIAGDARDALQSAQQRV
jgi:hypothetical protein